MPADADAGPAAFVTWMNKYGGGGPPGALLAEPLKGVSHGKGASKHNRKEEEKGMRGPRTA